MPPKILSFLGFFNLSNNPKEEIPKDDKGILILNRNNFRKAISEYNTLMVNFYSPYCPHCKTFEYEYWKLSKELQNSAIALAQVNAYEERILTRDQQIVALPTIRLYFNGYAMNYLGNRTCDRILTWLNKIISN